jgi:hypothetical protein
LASRWLGRIVDGGKAVVVTGLRPLIFHLGLLREFAVLLDEKVPVCGLPSFLPRILGPVQKIVVTFYRMLWESSK